MKSKRKRMVSNVQDLCAQAGVDTLDELGGILARLKFEIIVRPDQVYGADLELYAPTKAVDKANTGPRHGLS